MKLFNLLSILVWLASTSAQAESDGTNLTNLCVASYWSNGDSNHHSLYVKWDQFGPGTSWKPGEEPFPLQDNIQGKVWEVKSLIGDKKRLSLTLTDLRIRRLLVSQEYAEALGRPIADFTNQWTMTLNYFISGYWEGSKAPTNRCSWEYFVMLLDGSYGFEKVRPVNRREQASATPKPPPKGFQEPDENSPWEKIRKTRFKIPRIQWSTRGFPLDLSLEASRAKDYLVKEKSMTEESLRLDEIQIQDPFPRDKVREQAMDTHQSYPWVVFGFRQQTANASSGWIDVYMLLDGTILSTVQRKPGT